jgi:hypothetical protein
LVILHKMGDLKTKGNPWKHKLRKQMGYPWGILQIIKILFIFKESNHHLVHELVKGLMKINLQFPKIMRMIAK